MKKLLLILIALGFSGCSHKMPAKEYCQIHAEEYKDQYECYADLRVRRQLRAQATMNAAQGMGNSMQQTGNNFLQNKPVTCRTMNMGYGYQTVCN